MLARTIAWFTKGRREEPTLATHMGKIIGPDMVVQAIWPRVQCVALRPYLQRVIDEGGEWCITEPYPSLALWEEIRLRKLALEMVGWPYSLWEYPLYGLDGLISKVRGKPKSGFDVVVFRKLGWWERGIICSKTNSRIDIKLGRRPKILEYASPDDNWDYDNSPAWKQLPNMEWRVATCTKGWYRP